MYIIFVQNVKRIDKYNKSLVYYATGKRKLCIVLHRDKYKII